MLSPEAARRRRRLYPGVAVAAVVAAGTTVAGLLNDHGARDRSHPGVSAHGRIDPLAYDPADDRELTARATRGYSHVLYALSPGGVQATAARVARYRPAVERAARHSGGVADADTLEALVFLESGGRPDAIAGSGDPENAAGLTQIVAQTGQGLLGMQIDLPRSRALAHAARRARARGRPAGARAALAARAAVDARFVPEKALAATARYLRTARGALGRDDLALVSYHMGIGNLQRAIAAYGGGDRPSYVRLFFDSNPRRHAAAWQVLSALGDDSSTYYWRVLAAREIMRMWRADRGALARRDELQTSQPSAEAVLHPPRQTRTYADAGAIERARGDGELDALPADPTRLGLALDPRIPGSQRALRPEAVRLARWMGRRVRDLSGDATPLTLGAAVRAESQPDPEGGSDYSLHTTGYAFDVLRRYGSRAQAMSFQFLLDRLQALDVIAWVRRPAAIHVVAASDAGRLVN
jgi:hypothetical protein